MRGNPVKESRLKSARVHDACRPGDVGLPHRNAQALGLTARQNRAKILWMRLWMLRGCGTASCMPICFHMRVCNRDLETGKVFVCFFIYLEANSTEARCEMFLPFGRIARRHITLQQREFHTQFLQAVAIQGPNQAVGMLPILWRDLKFRFRSCFGRPPAFAPGLGIHWQLRDHFKACRIVNRGSCRVSINWRISARNLPTFSKRRARNECF